MAQTYKMMLGTSGKQWEQLTVKDDGTMMLYFHGTDRSVTQEVTVITKGEWKGWLRSEKGSMFPGLESGKWQMRADVRGLTADVVETADYADYTDNEPVQGTAPAVGSEAESERTTEGLSPMCVDHQTSDISPQTSALSNQASDTLKAIGMVAAASVALFVIYETGLLIPLGLIGLATGGILK